MTNTTTQCYVSLSQDQVATVDKEDFLRLKGFNCVARKTKYGFCAIVSVNGKWIPMSHFILGKPPKGKEIDHWNGDGLDNRRSNLRKCFPIQNRRNHRKYSTNSTGYTGVYGPFRRRHGQKWFSRVVVKGKTIHLGYFRSPEKAAKAYDLAAKQVYGRFARLNFPNRRAA